MPYMISATDMFTHRTTARQNSDVECDLPHLRWLPRLREVENCAIDLRLSWALLCAGDVLNSVLPVHDFDNVRLGLIGNHLKRKDAKWFLNLDANLLDTCTKTRP